MNALVFQLPAQIKKLDSKSPTEIVVRRKTAM